MRRVKRLPLIYDILFKESSEHELSLYLLLLLHQHLAADHCPIHHGDPFVNLSCKLIIEAVLYLQCIQIGKWLQIYFNSFLELGYFWNDFSIIDGAKFFLELKHYDLICLWIIFVIFFFRCGIGLLWLRTWGDIVSSKLFELALD